MNNSPKEIASPLNLNIKNKISSLLSNASKAPPSPKQPFFIGVAGGTASGKTTVCNLINSQFHDQRVVLINQDSFYHSLSDEILQNVNDYNFDHPDAFDTELMLSMDKLLPYQIMISICVRELNLHVSIADL